MQDCLRFQSYAGLLVVVFVTTAEKKKLWQRRETKILILVCKPWKMWNPTHHIHHSVITQCHDWWVQLLLLSHFFLLTHRFAKSESHVSSGKSIIPIHLYRYHLFVIVVRTHRNDNERCNRTASSPSYDFPLLLILSLAYIAGAQNCKPGGIFRRCSNKFRTFLLHRRYAVFLCRENEYFYASNTVANMLFILFLCEQDENCASTVAVMNQHTSLSVKTHGALWWNQDAFSCVATSSPFLIYRSRARQAHLHFMILVDLVSFQ